MRLAIGDQVHKIHADARPDLFLQGEKKYTDEELSEIITNQSQTPVFVAEFDGVIVGYAFCQVIRTSTNNRNINTLYIDDLCVDETRRGQHIGKSLYEYVVAYAKENNFVIKSLRRKRNKPLFADDVCIDIEIDTQGRRNHTSIITCLQLINGIHYCEEI